MSGIVKVYDLLLEHPPRASYARLGSGPSMSQKPWTNNYNPILNPIVHMPTLDGVNGFLASEQYSPNSNSIYTADPSDIDRLNKLAYCLNYPDNVIMQTEGDVDRDFYQNLALPVTLAWQKNGHFLQRSLSGPPGPTTVSQTVDHVYSWQAGGVAENERCQVIGEMKQHGVIRIDEWKGRKGKSPITIRLGKELRGYAFLYKCPQVFVYDGRHLLMVQFRAKNFEDIKSANCVVDCCILARTPEEAGLECGARYALYRLLWRGWMRMTGMWSNSMDILLDGWRREFRFWSGRPSWTNGHDKLWDHPAGYTRSFNKNAWFWIDTDGNPVKDEDGEVIWDSIQVWSSS